LPRELPTFNHYLKEIKGEKPKSRSRTQPVQTTPPRPSSPKIIPPSRNPTVLAKPEQSGDYNTWINGKFGIAIPEIQIARESENLITRAINTYTKRNP